MRTTITQIGNSLGVILPKEVIDNLKVKKGDEIFITDTRFGVALSRYDAEIENQIEAAKQGMKEYHNTLRKLAE